MVARDSWQADPVRVRTPGTRRAVRLRDNESAGLEALAPDPDHSWRHDNIGRLFLFAFKAFEEKLLQELSASGRPEIKYVHLNLFRTVDYPAGTRLIDLARRVGITKAAMGQLAREGEKLGLFEIAPDPNDGRAKIVRFTAAGKRTLRLFRQKIEEEERVFEGLLGRARYKAVRDALVCLREKLNTPAAGEASRRGSVRPRNGRRSS